MTEDNSKKLGQALSRGLGKRVTFFGWSKDAKYLVVPVELLKHLRELHPARQQVAGTLAAMYYRCNRQSKTFASRETLASDLCKDVKNVGNDLRFLETAKLIKRHGREQRRSVTYELHPKTLRWFRGDADEGYIEIPLRLLHVFRWRVALVLSVLLNRVTARRAISELADEVATTTRHISRKCQVRADRVKADLDSVNAMFGNELFQVFRNGVIIVVLREYCDE